MTPAPAPIAQPTVQARACWLAEPGRAELRSEPLPPLGPGQVRVRALHSGISRGTETLVFRGEVPPSEFERMRAPFQQGDFPAPVKYGYCSVGVVEEVFARSSAPSSSGWPRDASPNAAPDSPSDSPSDSSRHSPPGLPTDLLGRTVFCLHPHQSHYVVPAEAVHLLPADVPPARAVLAANMETAVNALWDAAPRIGDRIAVVGGGTLGLLVAWLAGRLPGCKVELIDVRAERQAVAHKLGVAFALPGAARPEADLVIHASGRAEGLATALELAAFEATVLELSWYGTRTVSAALGAAFHARRLTLKSSQVGHVANAQRARWSHRRRFGLALSLLAEPALDALITDASPFDELPAVLARLAGASADATLCHRIDYPV